MSSFWRTKKRPSQQEEDQMVVAMRELVPEDVHRKLVQGGEEGLNEATFKRFLRAEEWNVEKAAKRLIDHAEWRVNFVPEGQISEEGLDYDLDEKKLAIQGTDKKGRAILYIMAKNHVYQAKRDWESLRRYTVYSLDTAVAVNDPVRNEEGKMIVIYDLTGLRYRNLDSGGSKVCLSMLQDHYPERLAQLWLYNAPTIVWGVWKIVSPMFDPVTRDKVKFVYGKDARDEFKEAIDLDVLPTEVGGRGKIKLVQDVAAALRSNLTKAEM